MIHILGCIEALVIQVINFRCGNEADRRCGKIKLSRVLAQTRQPSLNDWVTKLIQLDNFQRAFCSVQVTVNVVFHLILKAELQGGRIVDETWIWDRTLESFELVRVGKQVSDGRIG